MKDSAKTLAIVFALVITAALSGCSSKKDTSYFYDVVDATSAVQSYEGITEVNIKGFYGDDEITVNLMRDMSLIVEPFFADINEKSSICYSENEPEVKTARLVVDSTDSADMVYLYDNDKWLKESVTVEDLRNEVSKCDVIESGIMLMKSAYDIQKLGSEEINGEKADVYEGLIPNVMIADVLDITGAAYKFKTDWDSSYYENSGDLPVTLWVNSENIIIGYELDITNVMQNIVDRFYEENDLSDTYEDIKFESFKAKGTVSEYNNEIERAIPEEALNADYFTADDVNLENQ